MQTSFTLMHALTRHYGENNDAVSYLMTLIGKEFVIDVDSENVKLAIEFSDNPRMISKIVEAREELLLNGFEISGDNRRTVIERAPQMHIETRGNRENQEQPRRAPSPRMN